MTPAELHEKIAGENLHTALRDAALNVTDVAGHLTRTQDWRVAHGDENAEELIVPLVTEMLRTSTEVFGVVHPLSEYATGKRQLPADFMVNDYNERVFYLLDESAPRLRALARQVDALGDEAESAPEALIRLAEVCEKIADLGPATE